jgi:molybdate transport system regulatory protein
MAAGPDDRSARPMSAAGKRRGVTRIARAPAAGATPVRLTLRVDFGGLGALGPGKVRLLEAVAECGSIAAAARSLGMSYRRAWLLIDSLNRSFRHAAVTARPGGTRGGGAVLTDFGCELARRYRQMESAAAHAAKIHMASLTRALVPPPAVQARSADAIRSPARVTARAPRRRHGRRPE